MKTFSPNLNEVTSVSFGFSSEERDYHKSVVKACLRSDDTAFYFKPTEDVIAYLKMHQNVVIVVNGNVSVRLREIMQQLVTLNNPIVIISSTGLICYCLARLLCKQNVSLLVAPTDADYELFYRALVRGKRYISKAATLKADKGCNVEAGLSKMQTRVLECIKRMMTDKEIASVMHIAVTTVKSHKSRILDKYKIDNVFDLLVFLGVIRIESVV